MTANYKLIQVRVDRYEVWDTDGDAFLDTIESDGDYWVIANDPDQYRYARHTDAFRASIRHWQEIHGEAVAS